MEEMNVIQSETQMAEYESEPKEQSNDLLIGLGILGGLAAVVGGVLYATRNRRKKRRIERLKKEGYVIYSPDELAETEQFDEED